MNTHTNISPTQSGLTTELAIEMYRKMRLIRRFEERVIDLVNANEIAGVTHEYIGEEAIAVGVCSALQKEDVISSTHRGHGHIIAKGGEVRRMMAELLGRVTGYNRGKGGSMHIADLSLGIYGANGIVAAGVPIAAGAAWASLIKKTGIVAATFFGDGGANQGVVHETMNLAGIWKLPILFICENNQYAVTTPASYSTAGPGVSERARCLRVPRRACRRYARRPGLRCGKISRRKSAKRGRTHADRMYGLSLSRPFHSRTGASLTYRTPEEITMWRAKDPLVTWADIT